MNIIKKTITGLMLLFVLLPLAAQEKPDTVYTFRFVTDKDMFYVPFSGNDKELARLEECVERYRQDILAGKSHSMWTAGAPPERVRPTTLRWRKFAPTA